MPADRSPRASTQRGLVRASLANDDEGDISGTGTRDEMRTAEMTGTIEILVVSCILFTCCLQEYYYKAICTAHRSPTLSPCCSWPLANAQGDLVHGSAYMMHCQRLIW